MLMMTYGKENRNKRINTASKDDHQNDDDDGKPTIVDKNAIAMHLRANANIDDDDADDWRRIGQQTSLLTTRTIKYVDDDADADLLMVSPPPEFASSTRRRSRHHHHATSRHLSATATTTTTTMSTATTILTPTLGTASFTSPSLVKNNDNNNNMMMMMMMKSPPPPPNSQYIRDTIQRIGQTLDNEIEQVMEMIHREPAVAGEHAIGLLNDTDDDDDDDDDIINPMSSMNLQRRILMDDDDDDDDESTDRDIKNNVTTTLKSLGVEDQSHAEIEEKGEEDDDDKILNFLGLTLNDDSDLDNNDDDYDDDDESEYIDEVGKGKKIDAISFNNDVSVSSRSCRNSSNNNSDDDDDDDNNSVTCFDSCGCWELEEGGCNDLILPSSDTVVKWPKVRLPLPLYNKLFQHQRIGVQWMASLHRSKIKGGILADDMGMGKTLSTLSYLGSLMRAKTIYNAIVVCPKSVVRSWEREANLIVKNMCVSKAMVYAVTSDMKSEKRKRLFAEAFCSSAEAPRLVVTTYGLVSNHITDLTSMAATFPDHHWCYVVLDEGHVVKNRKTKTSQDVRLLARSEKTRRLLLTGTPIQNNMRELHALFDWATSSQLLGSIKTFLNQYGDPIEDGRQRNASDWAIKKAAEMNVKLQKVLQPYFLQRLKETEFEDTMPKKKELVVFTRLSAKQRRMYEHYTEHQAFDGVASSPLAAVSWLKMLCGHPSLVKDSSGKYKEYDDVDLLVKDSTKLQVLIALIHRLKRSGHRTLVFSQSTKMLDIMERALPSSIRHLRIDGSTAGKLRQTSVDHFNDNSSGIDIMLLSTKAAGVGITLTGASRAVIYDPSWNPSEDSQAVDRCYRIGQTKDVTVYRFISAGTVEEKMYEKQVHKDGIKRVVLSNAGATARYFDHSELKDLFKLAPDGVSATLEKFNKKSDNNAVESSGRPSFLTKHPMVIGVASHDVLYSSVEIEVDDETPFSRLPYQKTGIRKGVTPLNAQIDLTLDDSSPEMSLDLKPLKGGLNRTKQIIDDAKKAKRSQSSSSEAEQGGYVRDILRRADSLIVQKEYGHAMDVLLSSIEGDFALIKGDDKLAIHAKVAQLAGILGWL